MPVLVVGGGLAGMTAALALADAGLKVRLFERRAMLGGRASSFVEPGGEEFIDHCQHVTMRCCTNLDALFRRFGVSPRIHFQESVPFLDRQGRRSTLRASRLPAPFHLFPSFLGHRTLRVGQKMSLARAMFSVLREGPRFARQEGRPLRDWLAERGQGPVQVEAFWGPFLVSALNEEIDRMDAAVALRVVYEGLLKNRDAWQVGLPGEALAEITAKPGLEALRRAGVEVALNKLVSGVECELAGKDPRFRVRFADGHFAEGESLVLALPHRQAFDLVPQPQREDSFFAGIEKLGGSPIVSAHLWFDRQILDDEYVAFLGRTVQWAFRRPGNYVGLVVSAARSLEEKPKEEILEIFFSEIREAIPAAREARRLRSFVVKERTATFSAFPGSSRLRPPAKTPIPGLFLAGDWIDTGWPATMEGAVRGGTLAACALLESLGKPAPDLAPPLPVARLVRWLSRE